MLNSLGFAALTRSKRSCTSPFPGHSPPGRCSAAGERISLLGSKQEPLWSPAAAAVLVALQHAEPTRKALCPGSPRNRPGFPGSLRLRSALTHTSLLLVWGALGWKGFCHHPTAIPAKNRDTSRFLHLQDRTLLFLFLDFFPPPSPLRLMERLPGSCFLPSLKKPWKHEMLE